MNTILYCLSFGLIVVAKALGSEYRIPFKGQCPQIIPLPIKLSHTTAFMGNWYQYAVHPDYLQDKCIRRQFHGLEAWKHLAHTDNDKFIIQYYCYEHTIRHKGRQHLINTMEISFKDPLAYLSRNVSQLPRQLQQ
ncbi:uncharacterized protein LOC111518782 isoform X2 [Drosophila willistoni]|uniref:uncharacterized protein LOC111518782 isoform X2 n=1 Tax=Drosophila willistoni TaxID=7260 RepID=UPI001F07B889|nr:uncharacterized protein LOC111518782 isoform X2 [Drosophila willistoni]